MLYQGLVFLYPLITTPLISRAFGAEIVGIYSYTYAIAYYFSLAATLGIGNYGSRQIAMCRDDHASLCNLFWELYSLQLMCSIITVIIYAFYVGLSSSQYTVVRIFQGIMIIAAMVDISWFFSGMEHFKTMVFRNCAIKLSSLALIFLCVKDETDLLDYIIIMTCTTLLGQLTLWPVALKTVGKPRFFFYKTKKHISSVVQLFLPVIAINAYTIIDKMFLGVFRNMQEVGYFENSDKIVRMPVGLVNAAAYVMLPRSSYFIAHEESDRNNLYLLNTLKIVLILVIPITAGLMAITPQLVPWYLGADFLPCIKGISALSPLIIFLSINSILRMQYFIPNRKDRIYTTSILIGVVFNLVFNFIYTKKMGLYGVIIASTLSEVVSCAYLILHVYKIINVYSVWNTCIYSMISCIPMIAAVRKIGAQLGPSLKTNVIQLLIGIIVYGICILVGYKINQKLIVS